MNDGHVVREVYIKGSSSPCENDVVVLSKWSSICYEADVRDSLRSMRLTGGTINSRLRKGDVVLEDPRFSRQRTDLEPKACPSSSLDAPYLNDAVHVTPKCVTKRSLSTETTYHEPMLEKRIKAELLPQSDLDNANHLVSQPLPAQGIKLENGSPNEASTSAQGRQWFLQKFIDGVICGDPINLSELSFPVPIGRDAALVKIHLGGPKKKHVSRYHAELQSHADGLRIQCFSGNGILINHTQFLAKKQSAVLKNSDVFIIGDAPEEYKDSVQTIMFAVRCGQTNAKIADPKAKQPIVIDVESETEDLDMKTPIGSSNACPILIMDDDEDAHGFEGGGSVRVEENDGLSAMLMEFKQEVVHDEESAAESPSTVSSAGSPVFPQTPGETAPIRSCQDEAPRSEHIPVSKNPILAPIVPSRVPSDSPTESRINPFNCPPLLKMRKCADFSPTFNVYRRCILNLDFEMPDNDPNQLSEKIFVDFVRENASSRTLRDVTRVLFSFFCLEATSRVKSNWRKAHCTRRAAITAQAALSKEIVRLTVMLISEGRGQYTDCSALKLSASFVRPDGQGVKKRVVLGLVHKYETVDRRRRSGGIQVPAILAEDPRSSEIVDILEIDVFQTAFKGGKLNVDTFIELSRICEVKELKKILCLRRIPDNFCSFLRAIKPSNVMGPHDLKTSPQCPEQVARVTHCSMLTSEQTSVVCATLSLLSTPTTAVSMMLVEGEAGTGKTSVLLETAFECVVAKPLQTVLIFCKWAAAADSMAQTIIEIAQRKKFKLPNGEPLSICRVAGTRDARIQRVCLPSLLEQKRHSTLKQEIERKERSIQEQKKRINDLRTSFEDQVDKLPNFVKNRKVSEISQLELALENDIKERGILVERLKQPKVRYQSTPGATTVLESSNILICSTSDIETNIIGQAFRSGAAEISLVLIDQAQQCLMSDLLPMMQLNCQRMVMFGDCHQSAFLKHVVKHKFLKENNPYVPSVFAKCCHKYPNKKFRLTRNFRVRPPLRDIVANIFIRNSTPSVQTFDGSYAENNLSPLTIFDIDGEAPDEHVVERIVQACSKVVTKVHITHTSPQRFQSLNKKCSKELGISTKIGIPELLDADNISVLIIPLFDSHSLHEINTDPAVLYSILTRAARATILVGSFANMKDCCSVLDALAEQSKAVGRFFHHSARTFMQINISEILMHLRP